MGEFGKPGSCGDCIVTNHIKDFSEVPDGQHAVFAYAGFIPDYLSIEDDLIEIDERAGSKKLAASLKNIAAQTEEEIDIDSIMGAVQGAYGLDTFTERLTPIIFKHADILGGGDAQRGMSIVACATCCYSKNFDDAEAKK